MCVCVCLCPCLHPLYLPTSSQEDGDDGDCDGHTAALKEYNRIDAKLRRLCETKPSGRCNVPESIAKQWRAGGAARDELRKAFMVYELDKDRSFGVRFCADIKVTMNMSYFLQGALTIYTLVQPTVPSTAA